MISASTLASATTINFEQYPEGTFITTQYSTEGIVFSGGALQRTVPNYNYIGFPPHSGSGALGSPSGPITATFSLPVFGVSGYYADLGTFTVSAYDSSNNLISTAQYSADLGSSDPFSVAGSGISEVVFSSSAGPGTMVLDDISFTQMSTVPEPSSIVFLGFGLLGLAVGMHRNQKSFREAQRGA
jgi:hypothetical protein